MTESVRPATLVVVGAGPKGIAIATKQAVLRRLGYGVPDVILIDRQGFATHWSGEYGYTDGKRFLGTSPDKDIGFPYDSTAWGDAEANRLVDRMLQQYSWQAHLIATYRYASWIDRDRPRPEHRKWAAYLRWVGEQIQPTVVQGEVTGLSLDNERWVIQYQDPAQGTKHTLEADGVVLTGPGASVKLPGQPRNHPRVFDGETVWQALPQLASLRLSKQHPLRIGIVGTGETAGAAVVALLEALDDNVVIEILSPRGVLYSRDEGFEENQLFSNPDPHVSTDDEDHQHPLRWLSLTEADRREFVRRADRGVFSIQAVREMTRYWNVSTINGNALHVNVDAESVRVSASYGEQTSTYTYDYLVVARGFDPLTFLNWLDEPTRERIFQAAGSLDLPDLERAIGQDLALSSLQPRLHLPMLAGVTQGPGFPNLSCLGLLSERILAPYASR